MRKSALVVELKHNKNAYTAIQQLKDRHYTQAPEGYAVEILLVGINYGNQNKRHSYVIEKCIKES